MKLDQAIENVRRAERDLAGELRKVGERHAVEHDLYHLGQTLARQHEEAEVRGEWLRTRIKESSPQILAAG